MAQDKSMQSDSVMQLIGLLNLRINDMMMQLNVFIKTMIEENAALKKENADLKAKHKETSKS